MSQNESKPAKAIKQPDEIDQKLVWVLIQNPGATDQEVANTLSLSRRTVSRRRNSNIVQNLLAERLSLPMNEMRRLAVKSLSRLEDLIADNDPRIALAAAATIAKLVAWTLAKQDQLEADARDEIVYVSQWGSLNESG